MRRLTALIGLCALLLLSSCASSGAQAPPPGSVGVYFAAAGEQLGGPAVDCEYCVLSGARPPVEELMDRLLSGPREELLPLASPFPAGVTLRSWSLEDGRLSLDLSEQYGGLSGVDLTVADYCIALTLCQLEGVDSVSITVEGEEVVFRSTQQLRAGDVILTGAEEEPVYVNVTLWFPRREGDGLGVETRQLLLTKNDNLAAAAMEALLSGPAYESLGLTAPEGTALLSLAVEDGVCVLDLSGEFLANIPEDPRVARLMVYGLVNTLCSLDAIELVQIRAEGEVVEFYGGLPTARPLEPNFALER